MKRDKTWVTVTQGARIVGVPMRTVRYWAQTKRVVSYQCGSRWRILLRSLRKLAGRAP